MLPTSLNKVWKVQTNSPCTYSVLTRMLRRYSTAITENTRVEVTTDRREADKYISERNVPMMLLPFTVKKLHHVHENMITLPKVLDKYKWLTKTISTPCLPSHYLNAMEDASEYSRLLKDYHDMLLHTVAYVKAYKNAENKRQIPERINFSLLSNILRLTMTFGNDADHLLPENSFLYHEPLLETHWVRNYRFYRTKFRPHFVLRTRNKLDVLEKPSAITPEELECLPGPYGPYDMNTYRQDTIHLRNQPAMDNYRLNPIQNCHTTIIQNNRMTTDEQFLAMGVITMFTQSAAQAQGDGVLHGMELKEPLVTQCIVTDGHRVAFMVYQLNTLYTLDDKGFWNRCWHSPVMEMFERREYPYHYMVYEDAECGKELEGFNEECFQLFVNFIRNKTV